MFGLIKITAFNWPKCALIGLVIVLELAGRRL